MASHASSVSSATMPSMSSAVNASCKITLAV